MSLVLFARQTSRKFTTYGEFLALPRDEQIRFICDWAWRFAPMEQSALNLIQDNLGVGARLAEKMLRYSGHMK
jgi:hypothetical protein